MSCTCVGGKRKEIHGGLSLRRHQALRVVLCRLYLIVTELRRGVVEVLLVNQLCVFLFDWHRRKTGRKLLRLQLRRRKRKYNKRDWWKELQLFSLTVRQSR
ncbi:uncharacterized protein LOC131327168 [Rhododendron vialii]|uniref:uncharacterized protein LOC131327168 n=1 Tax=Rhododendron vialii TaxID=182163 RepID=UPI00265E5EA8|nr:uncharacterized protein LOC131327168 [Rhododendron vialii]